LLDNAGDELEEARWDAFTNTGGVSRVSGDVPVPCLAINGGIPCMDEAMPNAFELLSRGPADDDV
jgi:hypothetical protein